MTPYVSGPSQRITSYSRNTCPVHGGFTFLKILGHYVICPGAIEQVMVMNNNIMTLGYTYYKHRIKNPPESFCKISYIGRLIAWISSCLDYNMVIQGRDWFLLRPGLPTVFTGTNNQEGPNTFDTFTRYMLWDSVCHQYLLWYLHTVKTVDSDHGTK